MIAVLIGVAGTVIGTILMADAPVGRSFPKDGSSGASKLYPPARTPPPLFGKLERQLGSKRASTHRPEKMRHF
jgi:hypothetical protein